MRFMLLNILVFAATFISHAQAEARFIRKGNRQYRDSSFREAEINYLKALELNPSSVKAAWNLGNSLYKQDNFGAAAEKYGALAEEAAEGDDASRYYYNLGNSFFKQGNYGESLNAYRKALLNNPDDMDAKHNLQMALRMLDKQQQQQQQQQEGSQENQQENSGGEGQEQQQDENNGDNTDEDGQSAEQLPRQDGQISKEDAERILQALENQEREVLKKVQEQKTNRQEPPVGKNW